MITKINEAKTLVKYISNSIVQHVIKIKNVMINVNVSVKIIVHAKKIIVEILGHIFVRTVGIQKMIADDSVIVHDENLSITDSISTNVTNFVMTNVTNITSTNVTSTVPINPDDSKI